MALQGLPAGGAVAFEVELAGFDRQPSQHAMSGAEKLERGAVLKEQGNALYKQVGRWELLCGGLARHMGQGGCGS